MANDLVQAVAPLELLADFGEILVRLGYAHTSRMATFRVRYQGGFELIDGNINDHNFDRVTTKLHGGQKLRVRAFMAQKKVAFRECLSFIEEQRGLLVGAQGLTVAYQELQKYLPQGNVFASFDKPEALWFKSGCHHLPCLRTVYPGQHMLALRIAEAGLLQGHAMLLFNDAG
jgi:hypothetical protein